MKKFWWLLLFCMACYRYSYSQNKIYKHQVSAGIGLVSFQKFIYPFQSEYLEYYKMKTKSLFHIKYAYTIPLKEQFTISVGANYAYLNYNDIYVNKQFANDPNLSADSSCLDFTTSSYLLRFNILYATKSRPKELYRWTLPVQFYVGGGIGYRSQSITNHSVSYIDSTGVYKKEIPKTVSNKMPLGLEITFGGTYFIAKNIGIYAEVGIAKSFIQSGIICKF